jgi:TonB family protein
MKIAQKCFLLLLIPFFVQQASAQKINVQLARRLAVIYDADQKYRVAAIIEAKKSGSGSAKDNELGRKQNVADLANLTEIEKIIKAYGYPGKSMVGKQSRVAFMVIQHNDLKTQEKYLPLFIKTANEGELDRGLLPLMIDRVRLGNGQPQLYGTQLSEIKNSKKVQIKPIEDEINVNIRRKAYGLGPLETYYKKWNINYKVPTSKGNPNPKELYATILEQSYSKVEAIGGDEGILSKLHYPEKARSNNIIGSVTVEFTVDKDGATKNIFVIEGLGYGCDEEAIRVIKESKYTNPERQESELRMKLPFPYSNNALRP